MSAIWEIPPPHETFNASVGQQTQITLRRYGNPDGPRLVLSHGNGLAIDVYYPFWSLLIEDFDLFVYDLRNHGRNALGRLADHNIPVFAKDQDTVLSAIDARCGKKPKVGVFHSVSALATLLAPSNGCELAAAVLFDPPLRKPGFTREEMDEASLRNAAMARRRSAHYADLQEFIDGAMFSPNFRHTVPGVVELLAETTLRPSPSGAGYELCCPPAYESQLMEYGRLFAAVVDLPGYGCPTKVFGADPTLPYSYTPTYDLSGMVDVAYDFLPDATHLLQREQPERSVGTMLEFLGEHGLV